MHGVMERGKAQTRVELYEKIIFPYRRGNRNVKLWAQEMLSEMIGELKCLSIAIQVDPLSRQ